MRTPFIEVYAGPFKDKIECATCGEPTAAWALYEVVEGDPDQGWQCGSCVIDQARPAEEPFQLSWEDVRARRFQMIEATDWTQLPDVAEETREAARAYRQLLRDVTEHASPAEAWAALDNMSIATAAQE